MAPKADALFLEVASSLRHLACDPAASWSFGNPDDSDGLSHAEEEFRQDKIDFWDAVEAVQQGKITDARLYGEEMRYRVEARCDGRDLVFIVSFSLEERLIEVITGWAK